MHHNGKILYDCQSVKLGYETEAPALRYLYKNSSKDFVSSSDLCPFFCHIAGCCRRTPAYIVPLPPGP